MTITRQCAIDTLASYHRAAADVLTYCGDHKQPCTCDGCKKYRRIDKDREAYFSHVQGVFGETAYTLWSRARELSLRG